VNYLSDARLSKCLPEQKNDAREFIETRALDLHQPTSHWGELSNVFGLKESPELLDGQARILDDSTHGKSVDWIVSGDCDYPLAIGHHDVFFLPNYLKACLFQRPHGLLGILGTG
jgi:hypothetical protein